jgi:hypothetical protein
MATEVGGVHKTFAAKSEASTQSQKDMLFLFNEAEVLGAHAQPAAQEENSEDPSIDVRASSADYPTSVI